MTTSPPPLLRVVYVSRSLLPETAAEAELERILARARRGNAALGITGALLFSEDCFAQALEGNCSTHPRHGGILSRFTPVNDARNPQIGS